MFFFFFRQSYQEKYNYHNNLDTKNRLLERSTARLLENSKVRKFTSSNARSPINKTSGGRYGKQHPPLEYFYLTGRIRT